MSYEVWLSCGDGAPHHFATVASLEEAVRVSLYQERSLNGFAEEHKLKLGPWKATIKEVAECPVE